MSLTARIFERAERVSSKIPLGLNTINNLFTLHISSYDFQVRAFLCGLVHFAVKIETELHVVLQKSRLRLLQFTSIADIFVLTKPPCNMFYGTFHIS